MKNIHYFRNSLNSGKTLQITLFYLNKMLFEKRQLSFI